MTRRAREPAAKIFEGVPEAVLPILEAARRAVLAAARDAVEVACGGARPRSPSMMWKLVRYRAGGEIVVTLGTFTRHASMFFARGAELTDVEPGLLEGTGKQLRYVTLRAPDDAERPGLRRILRRAFELVDEKAP